MVVVSRWETLSWWKAEINTTVKCLTCVAVFAKLWNVASSGGEGTWKYFCCFAGKGDEEGGEEGDKGEL